MLPVNPRTEFSSEPLQCGQLQVPLQIYGYSTPNKRVPPESVGGRTPESL